MHQLQYIREAVFTNSRGPGLMVWMTVLAFMAAFVYLCDLSKNAHQHVRSRNNESTHSLADEDVISPSAQLFILSHDERTVSAWNTRPGICRPWLSLFLVALGNWDYTGWAPQILTKKLLHLHRGQEILTGFFPFWVNFSFKGLNILGSSNFNNALYLVTWSCVLYVNGGCNGEGWTFITIIMSFNKPFSPHQKFSSSSARCLLYSL